jgi:hypothetical protein
MLNKANTVLDEKATTASKLTWVVILLSCLLFTTITSAHNQVVVVPMAGDDLTPLKNIVTVAKENGDFTSPVAAMASITDATSSNPYLVVIAPGLYTLQNAFLVAQQLEMKEYVSIVGSGQNVTILSTAKSSASPSASAAVVVGANNASVRDLTIKNVPGAFSTAANAIGIFIEGASPTISDVTISVAANRNFQYGVRNVSNDLSGGSASPILSGVTISMSGSNNSQTGVYNIKSSGDAGSGPELLNVKIDVENANGTGYGVLNDTASDFAIIRGSKISAPNQSVRASTGSSSTETIISDSILFGAITGDPKCNFVYQYGTSLNEDCAVEIILE